MSHNDITAEHSRIILTKMCEMVGADAETFDFESEEWYRKHTWSNEQQEEFIDWLADRLVAWKYCRKGNYRGMPHGQYEARKLTMNYGWMVK